MIFVCHQNPSDLHFTATNLTRRIIPCLDVKNGRVVKVSLSCSVRNVDVLNMLVCGLCMCFCVDADADVDVDVVVS